MSVRPLRCPRCGSQKIEVYQLRCNFSAFNGYHWTRSRYSGVRCMDCGTPWRTPSDQVDQLPRSEGRRD